MKNFKRAAWRIGKVKCTHPHAIVWYSGGYSFSGGEVDDDIQEHIYCPDCGADDWRQVRRHLCWQIRERNASLPAPF